MKSKAFAIALPALFVTSLALAQETAKESSKELTLNTEAEKLSYVIGMDIGNSIKQLGPDADVNLDIITRAMKDVMESKETLLTPQEANEVKQAYSQKMQKQFAAQRQVQAEENLAEGKAFLEKNKAREGVKTTESGLQYEVLEEGEGPKPKEADTVTVNYRGTLIDDTEFDSSYKRGQPATFPVNGVIPGWTEALQLMPVGSKYRVYIPADLAYGERGAGQAIGPNATLIFDVELLSIGEPQTGEQQPQEKPQEGAKQGG